MAGRLIRNLVIIQTRADSGLEGNSKKLERSDLRSMEEY